jgi:hypothetical protein
MISIMSVIVFDCIPSSWHISLAAALRHSLTTVQSEGQQPRTPLTGFRRRVLVVKDVSIPCVHTDGSMLFCYR